MHGRAKVKTSVTEQEKKKREREAKVNIYKKLMGQLWEKRRKEEFDDDALKMITEVLSCNPDIYSLWNFRRQILLHYISNKQEEELSKILKSELNFTEACIKLNPKSYSAWHHRQWLLENFPHPNLQKELELCTLYLKLDERNFHCWDFRRWVATKLNVPDEKELDYTMDKINDNFSNYSSWHYRSKLLPRVYPDSSGVRPINHIMHLNELELVVNAAFTDPNDQSAWFYQRWLLGRTDTVSKPIRALVNSNKQLIIAFSSPVSLSQVKFFNCDGDFSNFVQIGPCLLCKDVSVVQEETIEMEVCGVKYKIELTLSSDSQLYTWSDGTGYQVGNINSELASVLNDQLNTCNQLLDYEPDSKWTLLTSVHMMGILDRHKYKATIMERLKLLQKVDSTRIQYYIYLFDKYSIEYELEEEKANFCSIGSSLKCLVHMQYLLLTETVDLSENQLENLNLSDLIPLQCCKKLKLDGNKISSLEDLPRLPELETLSLSKNSLKLFQDILPYLDRLPKLKMLNLSQNPVASIESPSFSQYACLDIILSS